MWSQPSNSLWKSHHCLLTSLLIVKSCCHRPNHPTDTPKVLTLFAEAEKRRRVAHTRYNEVGTADKKEALRLPSYLTSIRFQCGRCHPDRTPSSLFALSARCPWRPCVVSCGVPTTRMIKINLVLHGVCTGCDWWRRTICNTNWPLSHCGPGGQWTSGGRREGGPQRVQTLQTWWVW